MMRVVRDSMYSGRMMKMMKKMVATAMTWLEGKDGSPEPLGRVARMMNLSKTK